MKEGVSNKDNISKKGVSSWWYVASSRFSRGQLSANVNHILHRQMVRIPAVGSDQTAPMRTSHTIFFKQALVHTSFEEFRDTSAHLPKKWGSSDGKVSNAQVMMNQVMNFDWLQGLSRFFWQEFERKVCLMKELRYTLIFRPGCSTLPHDISQTLLGVGALGQDKHHRWCRQHVQGSYATASTSLWLRCRSGVER